MHRWLLDVLRLALVAGLVGHAPTLCAQAEQHVKIDRDRYEQIGRFDSTGLAREQGTIRVLGNRFVGPDGHQFIFRGVSIADPDKLEKEGRWTPALFREVAAWGANTLRIPVHPRAWRERGQAAYLALLDQAVRWANQEGLYLIIDWHSIGHLPGGHFQHPMYVTDHQETFRFWHDIAFRYRGVPTIAVYELFNEPTTFDVPWGEAEWAEWKATNEQLIDVIYAIDRDVIPLVAGFNWAYDLTPIAKAPIEREGVAYTSHPYPQKERPVPAVTEAFFDLWEQHWGFASQRYPLLCTELGWVRPDGYGAHEPVKDDGRYGPRIIEFMEARGISWTAWVFDPHWSPTLINDWDFTPSEQGAFFKQVLQGKAGLPAAR